MDLLDSSTPVTEAAVAMETEDLRIALVEAAASIAAAQARLAQAMGVFRARNGEHDGSGFSSFGQWASVDLGLSSRAASGLADVGDALTDRPVVRAAWESGSLSTTKAQCVLGVVTDSSEAGWCELAREASATQLSPRVHPHRRARSSDQTNRRARPTSMPGSPGKPPRPRRIRRQADPTNGHSGLFAELCLANDD